MKWVNSADPRFLRSYYLFSAGLVFFRERFTALRVGPPLHVDCVASGRRGRTLSCYQWYDLCAPEAGARCHQMRSRIIQGSEDGRRGGSRINTVLRLVTGRANTKSNTVNKLEIRATINSSCKSVKYQ